MACTFTLSLRCMHHPWRLFTHSHRFHTLSQIFTHAQFNVDTDNVIDACPKVRKERTEMQTCRAVREANL